jgi:hypothetical protein
MRRALHDGARGIAPQRLSGGAPATHATTVLGTPAGGRRGSRGATRPQAPATKPTTALPAPRKPRQGAPRTRAAATAPPPRGGRPPRRRRGRLAGVLLALLALVLIVVAVVVLTAPAPTRVVLRNVVYSDIQQASSALKQLISENTK